jgi:Zn-dependent oligopeptidase
MKTSELISALEQVGRVYTNKDKTKPSDPVLKVIAFLKKRTEHTLEDILLAGLTKAQAARTTKPKIPLEISAVAKQYLEKLNSSNLSHQELEKILDGVKKLQKTPLVQVARAYSFKSRLDTKEKALAAIREEFFRRARDRDKARKEENSLLM